MKGRMWMTMVVLAVVSAGCESTWTCSDFCAEAKKCDAKASLDCATLCQSATKVNDQATCGIEWDSLMLCEQDHATEICSASACGSELSDWGTCALGYCMQHLTEEPVCYTSAFE